MSTTSWSWIFSLERGDVPEKPFTSRDPEFAQMFEKYSDNEYLQNSAHGYFSEWYLDGLATKLGLPALSYIQEPFVLLDGERLKAVVDAYEKIMELCKSDPESVASYPPVSSEDIAEAMRLSYKEFADVRFTDDVNNPECGNAYKLLGYIFENHQALSAIQDSGKVGLYMLLQH